MKWRCLYLVIILEKGFYYPIHENSPLKINPLCGRTDANTFTEIYGKLKAADANEVDSEVKLA